MLIVGSILLVVPKQVPAPPKATKLHTLTAEPSNPLLLLTQSVPRSSSAVPVPFPSSDDSCTDTQVLPAASLSWISSFDISLDNSFQSPFPPAVPQRFV